MEVTKTQTFVGKDTAISYMLDSSGDKTKELGDIVRVWFSCGWSQQLQPQSLFSGDCGCGTRSDFHGR